MTIVPIRDDPVARVRAEAYSLSRQAVIIALDYPNPEDAARLVAPLGITERTVLRARRVVRDDRALALLVRAGELSLDAADHRLAAAAAARSVGPAVIDALVRRIEAITSSVPRRAVALALAEREEGLTTADATTARKRLGINGNALKRARHAVARDPAAARRALAGETSLNNAAASSPVARVDSSVRVDAAWVGREVSRKLDGALDAIAELPLAADVADLLREHSSLTVEKLDRALNWLGELRHAFGK